MKTKKCRFCGEIYDVDGGHGYDECVRHCMTEVDFYQTKLGVAKWHLAQALNEREANENKGTH